MAVFDVLAARDVLEATLAPWARETGFSVEAVTPDLVTLRLPFLPILASADGSVSGAALIACADAAMRMAISAASGDHRAARAVDQTINWISPIVTADAVVAARVVRLGKSIAFAATEIRHAETGAVAGHVAGTYALA